MGPVGISIMCTSLLFSQNCFRASDVIYAHTYFSVAWSVRHLSCASCINHLMDLNAIWQIHFWGSCVNVRWRSGWAFSITHHCLLQHRAKLVALGWVTVGRWVMKYIQDHPRYSACLSEFPSRTLHSSDTNLLSVPRVCTCFGSRSFSAAAPTIWNSLPFDIHNRCSLASFRRKLKTFYFSTSSHI